MGKTALITGITGQTGSYMAEFLLSKGYQVSGIVRRSSNQAFHRIGHLLPRLKLYEADLTDQSSLDTVLSETRPDEIYNLAAQSFVPTSVKQPILTATVTGLGVIRFLESIKRHSPLSKFYQASSSEMFGKVLEIPQTEKTPFHPRSAYGVSKVLGHYITINYRESFGLYAVSGISFNHESPRRGLEFVSRKISNGVAKIRLGMADELRLGNINAKRDWGFAGDYVAAMHLALQQPKPSDYVIATGEVHTVREFAEAAFEIVGLNWKKYVKIDKSLFRPAEVDLLHGDASKIRKLGWKPRVKFLELVHMMVYSDLKELGRLKWEKKSALAI